MSKKHGFAPRGKKGYLYSLWSNIKHRCSNRRDHNYGGRGIRVFVPWRRDFERFARDVLGEIGERPSRSHSIDRKNNDGDYVPGNIRWATLSEQARNKRQTIIVEIDGRRRCVMDWARELGIPADAVYMRIFRGWDPRRALITPTRLGRHPVLYEFAGKKMSAKDWASEVGISYVVLKKRIANGWDIERALTQPVRGA